MGNRNDALAARRAGEVIGYDLTVDLPDVGIQVYAKPVGDQFIAKCFIGKAGRPAWFYQFRSAAEMDAHVERSIRGRAASLEAKAKAKADRNVDVKVDVGDVFKCSWGYDQTQIDYYQVVRVVGARSVEIRKIGALAWDEGPMHGRCVPDVDNFIGPPMVKRLKSAGREGAAVRIHSFANAYRMDPVVEGAPVYASSFWSEWR